jgi:hypothetical protein
MPHPARLEADQLLDACDVRFTRRSGPGGQNRNKVETAAILTHRPTGLTAEANERRSQAQNRDVALHRLRLRLALDLRTQPDPEGPSPLWRSRLQAGRLRISPDHPHFPAILAEALDHLATHGWDPRPAANLLGCSPSQLIKLLANEPRALLLLNRQREALGLHPFR